VSDEAVGKPRRFEFNDCSFQRRFDNAGFHWFQGMILLKGFPLIEPARPAEIRLVAFKANPVIRVAEPKERPKPAQTENRAMRYFISSLS
jgi:hypothetical protein